MELDDLKTPFYFLRHGQTDANKQGLFHGHTDLDLNTIGLSQAHEAAQKLKNENIDEIYSSPLKRAYTTASIVSEIIKKPIKIIDEMKEVSFGNLEGIYNPQPREFLFKWIKNEVDAKYNIEPFEDLKERIQQGMFKIFSESKNTKLIVSHGVVYYALCQVLNIDYVDIENCQHIYHKF